MLNQCPSPSISTSGEDDDSSVQFNKSMDLSKKSKKNSVVGRGKILFLYYYYFNYYFSIYFLFFWIIIFLVLTLDIIPHSSSSCSSSQSPVYPHESPMDSLFSPRSLTWSSIDCDSSPFSSPSTHSQSKSYLALCTNGLDALQQAISLSSSSSLSSSLSLSVLPSTSTSLPLSSSSSTREVIDHQIKEISRGTKRSWKEEEIDKKREIENQETHIFIYCPGILRKSKKRKILSENKSIKKCEEEQGGKKSILCKEKSIDSTGLSTLVTVLEMHLSSAVDSSSSSSISSSSSSTTSTSTSFSQKLPRQLSFSDADRECANPLLMLKTSLTGEFTHL